MDKTQYFIYSLTQPFTLKQDWYFTFFSIFIDSNGNNPYLRNLNNTIEVKVDGKWVPLDVYKLDEPIYQAADKITLPPNTLLNQKYETNTTIGRAIANRILLTYPFKEKIEYKNDHFGIGDIENIISELLRIDKVTVEELLSRLDGDERKLIYMRYFQEMTQTQIAQSLGISQVQVSRLEKKILEKMKKYSGISE